MLLSDVRCTMYDGCTMYDVRVYDGPRPVSVTTSLVHPRNMSDDECINLQIHQACEMQRHGGVSVVSVIESWKVQSAKGMCAEGMQRICCCGSSIALLHSECRRCGTAHTCEHGSEWPFIRRPAAHIIAGCTIRVSIDLSHIHILIHPCAGLVRLM